MSVQFLHILHQAFFGGVAAVGFAVLFNCKPSMLWLCFGAGALALATRTVAQECGFTLPLASFFAALLLATLDRVWQEFPSPRGSVLAVVGAIPMVPGGIAAKVLISLFAMVRTGIGPGTEATVDTWHNLITLVFTLAAIGTALALPSLIEPAATRNRLGGI